MRWTMVVVALVAMAAAGCTSGTNVEPSPAPSAASSSAAPAGLTPAQLRDRFPAAADLPSGWSIAEPSTQAPSAAAPTSQPTTDLPQCDAALASLAGNVGALSEAESAEGRATLKSGPSVLDLHLIAFRPGQAHAQMSAIARGFAACDGATTQVNGATVTVRALTMTPVGDDFGGITLTGASGGAAPALRAAFTRSGDIGIALLEEQPGASDTQFSALLRAAVAAAR